MIKNILLLTRRVTDHTLFSVNSTKKIPNQEFKKIFNIDGTELITVHTNKMTKVYRMQTI